MARGSVGAVRLAAARPVISANGWN